MSDTTLGKQNLKGDIFGGLNAGIVALPVALGFGVVAGLEPIHGLYGAIFLGFFAAIFGGTKTLISNPTGPMAVVTAEIVAGLAMRAKVPDGASVVDRLEVIFPYLLVIFLVAGLMQILFGVVRLGKFVSYIPTPVISGFMSGIGVIIIINQIKSFLGVDAPVKGSLNILLALPELVTKADFTSVLLASTTIAIIYLFPKITKAVPSTLVAIVVVTLGATFLGVDSSYRIGNIPNALPTFKFGAIGDGLTKVFSGQDNEMLQFVLVSAIYLAAIGMIDSLLTSVVADNLTKTKHDSNRELIGQGLGNMISGMFGGMMGAGTTPATVLNINSGGNSRWSGRIHAIVLALVLVVAAPVAAYIPKAALAGVLIPIGISILDFEVFRQVKKIPRNDNAVMFAVLGLTAFYDLMWAVAVGLIMASLIFMKKMADVVEIGSRSTKVDRLVNQLIDNFENAEEFRKQVYVKNLKGPVFFGFASRFEDSMANLKGVKCVVINMGEVPYMDQSGLYTFRDVVQDLLDRGINVCISELNDDVMNLLEGVGFIPNVIDDKHVFSSVEETIMWLNEPGHLDNQFALDDELYIPSAYTPNGDGINDEWEIRNIDKFPASVVKIFNREGKQLFESEGYKEMWEGVYEGRSLPNDTYLYEIDLGDGSDVKKGKVTIFR